MTHTDRDPVRATTHVVPPYLYKLVWQIAYAGPLRAAEIAEDHNRAAKTWERWTPLQAANRMRTLTRLKLIRRDSAGFYVLTPEGRAWITLGAE